MKKHVNYEEYAKAPVSPLRFHAQWRLFRHVYSADCRAAGILNNRILQPCV